MNAQTAPVKDMIAHNLSCLLQIFLQKNNPQPRNSFKVLKISLRKNPWIFIFPVWILQKTARIRLESKVQN